MREDNGKLLRPSDLGVETETQSGASDSNAAWGGGMGGEEVTSPVVVIDAAGNWGDAATIAEPVIRGSFEVEGIKASTAYELFVERISKWTLESAMEGAAAAGAEIEMVSLYDEAFKGCASCFACKLKGAKTGCLCAMRDPLTPILEKALAADVLVVGSPIYFSSPTGPTRSFLERLMFPVLTYNARVDEETGAYDCSNLGRKIACGMVYTMGCTEGMVAECRYPEMFAETDKFANVLFGHGETVYAYNTYQFDVYAKYDVAEGVEAMRAAHREAQWPKDLKAACDLGARLVEKARGF